jgi:uncharacterized protein (DUF1778 family)
MAATLATLNPLTCRLLPAQVDLLDEAAKAANVTRSAFVRRAVMEQVKVTLTAHQAH